MLGFMLMLRWRIHLDLVPKRPARSGHRLSRRPDRRRPAAALSPALSVCIERGVASPPALPSGRIRLILLHIELNAGIVSIYSNGMVLQSSWYDKYLAVGKAQFQETCYAMESLLAVCGRLMYSFVRLP